MEGKMVTLLEEIGLYYYKDFIYLSLSLSNQHTGSPFFLIIGLWCSNPGS